MNIIEASIADLRTAIERGDITSAALTTAYLERIDRFDQNGPCLNAVPVLNPKVVLLF